MVIWSEEGSVRCEDDYARRLVDDGFQRGRAASTIFYHPNTHVRVVVHATTHVRSHGVGAEEDAIEDVRMVPRQGAWHSSLRWTEKNADRLRQALLEGLGLRDESKTVNSRGLAAMLNVMSLDRSDCALCREGDVYARRWRTRHDEAARG